MAFFARISSKRVQSCLISQCRHYSAPVDSIPASKQRFIPDQESSHFPKGFLLGTAHAGVKASNKTKDDVCIIASEKLCNAAGFFTKNAFRAAPVTVSKKTLEHNQGSGIRGVVINSGCANAVTGTDGFVHADAMASKVDELFAGETFTDPEVTKLAGTDSASASDAHRTLVMSTGVIGQKLPIDKILNVLPRIKERLGSGYDAWFSASKAIMTTDTFPKLVTTQFTLPSHPKTTYTIAGISKGAGMIHPNLGTLLSVICTDVAIARADLQKIGDELIPKTFNSISIDGDTSTNDSVVILANGAAAPFDTDPMTKTSGHDWTAFRQALLRVMRQLSTLVVRDGEGATKFIKINVNGASSTHSAKRVAERIAQSPLVKTAMYGRDANWGRILCAIGNSGESIDPSCVTVSFGTGVYHRIDNGMDVQERMVLVKQGQPQYLDEELAKEVLEKEDITVFVNLNDGEKRKGHNAQTKYWTCDFSHEYVTINGDYRT
ncbi:ArgJ-like protein [Elsinoe fawcettii]|nr:ArgJ-like protein [Elsinoe fawcettii]